MQFQLNLKHTRATLTELSRLRLEQLAEDDRLVQTRMIQPRFDYPSGAFEQGWSSGQGMIQLSVPAEDLEPGRWRVTVEGKIGKEYWRSERIKILLP